MLKIKNFTCYDNNYDKQDIKLIQNGNNLDLCIVDKDGNVCDDGVILTIEFGTNKCLSVHYAKDVEINNFQGQLSLKD